MIRPAITYSNILLLTTLLFVVGDLYFAHTDTSCIHSKIVNAKVGFGLGSWLKISGYTGLVFLIFPLVSCYLVNLSPSLLLIYMVFSVLYVFFKFIWFVIGAFMFWGYLWGARTCSKQLNIYMWINLTYNLISLFVLCRNQQQIYKTTYISKQQSII